MILMKSIIGVGLFGYFVDSDSKRLKLPGRLVIRSPDIKACPCFLAVVGNRGNELSASFNGDYLKVQSGSLPYVEDGKANIRVTKDGIVSNAPILVAVSEDGLNLVYTGYAWVGDDGESLVVHHRWDPPKDPYTITRVTGEKEKTCYVRDLVSKNELYSEFRDDGIDIYYSGDAEFSIEMEEINHV